MRWLFLMVALVTIGCGVNSVEPSKNDTPVGVPGDAVDVGPNAKLEKAIREEGRRRLAEAYCEKIGSSDSDSCYEAVADGDVAPEDIFEPEYPDEYRDPYGGDMGYDTYP